MKVQHGLRTAVTIALAIFSPLLFVPTMAAAERPADAGSQGLANGPTVGVDHRADRAAANFTEAIAEAVASVDTGGGQICDGTTGSPGGNVDDDGAYGNNCDFGPSQNGNGDGAAVGKPCAGCVGNADDMNPGGQLPGPKNDNNAGYECDPQGAEDGGNAGVGVGNPAHTGCADDEPGSSPVYECRAPTDIDETSAWLHGYTTDASVIGIDVVFNLDPPQGQIDTTQGSGGIVAADGLFSQRWIGLTPNTRYVFTVTFTLADNSTKVVSSPDCDPFRTRSQKPPPPAPPSPPAPPGPPPEPNAPVGVPTEIEGAEIVNRRPPEVLGVQFNNPGVAPAAFARTGSEPGPLVTAALMMIFVGALLAAVMRRQHAWVDRQ